MLGRLLQSAASTFAPPGASVSRPSNPPLESTTEEAYTRELLFPDVSALRASQQHGVPFYASGSRLPAAARDASSFDDRGGIDVAYPADIRVIVAQDANSRYTSPQVLFDSRPLATLSRASTSPLVEAHGGSAVAAAAASGTTRGSRERALSRNKSLTSPNLAATAAAASTTGNSMMPPPRSTTPESRRGHTPRSSLFGSPRGAAPPASPTSPRSPDGRSRGFFGEIRPRSSLDTTTSGAARSSFESAPVGDLESSPTGTLRDAREETDALLACMFGAPGFRLEPCTKVHVIPKRSHDTNQTGSTSTGRLSPDIIRPLSSGGAARRRTPLVRSTSAADISAGMLTPSELHERRTTPSTSKVSIMFTRLLTVTLTEPPLESPSAEAKRKPTEAAKEELSMADRILGDLPEQDDASSDPFGRTRSSVKQRKVPMYAVAVILDVPSSHPPRSRVGSSTGLVSLGTSLNDHGLSSSYRSDRDGESTSVLHDPERLPMQDAGSDRLGGSLDSVVSSEVCSILSHWNILSRALELLEVRARARLSVLLAAAMPSLPRVCASLPDPPQSQSMRDINFNRSGPIATPRSTSKHSQRSEAMHLRRAETMGQQSVYVAAGCLQDDFHFKTASDTIAQRLISALRTRRVITGQHRWGAWREEARWVERWARSKERSNFFFVAMTAFLGQNTSWLPSVAPAWYRQRHCARHLTPSMSTAGRELRPSTTCRSNLLKRTAIVCSDKMAARRLIFLLAEFLPATPARLPVPRMPVLQQHSLPDTPPTSLMPTQATPSSAQIPSQLSTATQPSGLLSSSAGLLSSSLGREALLRRQVPVRPPGARRVTGQPLTASGSSDSAATTTGVAHTHARSVSFSLMTPHDSATDVITQDVGTRRDSDHLPSVFRHDSETQKDSDNHLTRRDSDARSIRHDSDARSIGPSALNLSQTASDLRKAVVTTDLANSSTPVAHLTHAASDLARSPFENRPSSSESVASLALTSTLQRTADSASASPHGSSGRWGSVVSGFWSNRRSSSTEGSEVPSPTSDRRPFSREPRKVSPGKLARMVEEASLVDPVEAVDSAASAGSPLTTPHNLPKADAGARSSSPDPGSAGSLDRPDRQPSAGRAARSEDASNDNDSSAANNTGELSSSPLRHQTVLPSSQMEERSASQPRHRNERLPLNMSFNEDDGYIDIAPLRPPSLPSSSLGSSYTSMRFASSFQAGSHLGSNSGFLLGPNAASNAAGARMSQDMSSPWGSWPPEQGIASNDAAVTEHLLDAAGWLHRFHPVFSLQAVRPYKDLEADIHTGLRTEAALVPSPRPERTSQPAAMFEPLHSYGTEHAPGKPAKEEDCWQDVCSTLVINADSFRVEIHRLQRRIYSWTKSTAQGEESYATTSNQPSAKASGSIPEERIIVEHIDDHESEPLLVDALERVLARSRTSSRAPSRAPSPPITMQAPSRHGSVASNQNSASSRPQPRKGSVASQHTTGSGSASSRQVPIPVRQESSLKRQGSYSGTGAGMQGSPRPTSLRTPTMRIRRSPSAQTMQSRHASAHGHGPMHRTSSHPHVMGYHASSYTGGRHTSFTSQGHVRGPGHIHAHGHGVGYGAGHGLSRNASHHNAQHLYIDALNTAANAQAMGYGLGSIEPHHEECRHLILGALSELVRAVLDERDDGEDEDGIDFSAQNDHPHLGHHDEHDPKHDEFDHQEHDEPGRDEHECDAANEGDHDDGEDEANPLDAAAERRNVATLLDADVGPPHVQPHSSRGSISKYGAENAYAEGAYRAGMARQYSDQDQPRSQNAFRDGHGLLRQSVSNWIAAVEGQ